MKIFISLSILEAPKRVLWQDEMQLNAAFMLHFISLHCLLRVKLKQPSGTETHVHVHHNIENSTCDPLKYKMGIMKFHWVNKLKCLMAGASLLSPMHNFRF